MRPTRFAPAALLAVLALTGCGGSEPAPSAQVQPPAEERLQGEQTGAADLPDEVVDISGTEPVGEMTAGSVASLVECRDWNGADDAEKGGEDAEGANR